MRARQKIDYLEAGTFKALFLASLGLSTRAIERATSLSPGQINYRTKQAGIKRADYRNGGSVFAKIVLESDEVRRRAEQKAHGVLKAEDLI